MSCLCDANEGNREVVDAVYAEIDRSTRALSMAAAAATDGAAARERGRGAAGGHGLHAGPQGHLYRAEEGADEPVVQLGFIAINGRPYMAWKRQASLIGERLLFLIA